MSGIRGKADDQPGQTAAFAETGRSEEPKLADLGGRLLPITDIESSTDYPCPSRMEKQCHGYRQDQ